MRIKLLYLVLLITTIGFAQKKTVAVSTFEATANVSVASKYVEAIQNRVKESIRKTNRFKVVDRGNYKKLLDEREFQKKKEFIDGKLTSGSSFEGAEQIVTGTVNQITFSQKTTQGGYYYKCRVSFTIEIVDVVSAKVIASASIAPKKNILETIITTDKPDTKEAALFETLEKTQDEIDKFIAENFPVTAKIMKITEATPKKAKLLLLNTGEMNGTREKQLFQVVEIIKFEDNGEKFVQKKQIGMARITQVEGDKLSEAKVIKGGDLILEKFNSGAKIECYSQN